MIFCKWPKKIDNIIFFDFDETIRPFAIEDRNRTAIKELEILLQKISSEFNAIFGWISGSNFSSLIEKSNDYIGLYPHFIGSSLGSELVFSKNDSYNASIEWDHHIKQSGFRLDLVDDFVRRAGMEGFNLTPQDETYQGRHKRSYYFYEAPSVANHLTTWGLVNCNTESNLSVLVTRCNPAAGDPEGAYDVDLLPSCASKGKQCKFITKLFSIDQRNTIAFGDSANDSEMLNFVAHPYAVANGDLTSITANFKVTNGDYCDGILDTLKRYFYSEKDSVQHKLGISESSFGTLLTGESTKLYTLTNANGLVVKVTDFGGAITSIITPDKGGINGDIVLGFDTVTGYAESKSYFGALVGRYANQIDRGEYELNGKKYQLTVNDGGNHLHGGTVGLDKVLWGVKTFTTESSVGLILSHLSPDGDQGYPGNLNVTATYEFNNENELSITYHATTDKPTPINLTQHPYFNLSTKGSILNHELQINAHQYTPANQNLIPTGEIASVENTPFDFTTSHKIGDHISQEHIQLKNGGGYDHNWVLAKDSPNKWGMDAKLYDQKTGRALEVWSDTPGIQFYSGNFLDGKLTGKGVQFQYRGALCLEPQSFPDSPNKAEFPSTILMPNSEYSRKIMFKFSVE